MVYVICIQNCVGNKRYEWLLCVYRPDIPTNKAALRGVAPCTNKNPDNGSRLLLLCEDVEGRQITSMVYPSSCTALKHEHVNSTLNEACKIFCYPTLHFNLRNCS